MPVSTAAPPYVAPAMAATPAGEGPLLYFFSLEPLVLHGADAAVHVLLALAVAGRFLFRRCGLSVAKDGEEARGRGSGGGGRFRCHGVAACATWALAAAEVLLAAYSCYLGATSGSGWSRDAVVGLVDAAARAVAGKSAKPVFDDGLNAKISPN